MQENKQIERGVATRLEMKRNGCEVKGRVVRSLDSRKNEIVEFRGL